MKISAIVAMSENGVIGIKNQLPWNLPADLKHFKKITWGKPIFMGRKTFTSIGRALPGRLNVVLSQDIHFKASGCMVFHTIQDAFNYLVKINAEEVFIIGGATLFQQTLLHVERLYITLIHHVFAGDTFFPHFDKSAWCEINREDFEPDDKNPYAYSFMTWERKR